MSASARYSPAREVRRKYPEAKCVYFGGRWHVYPDGKDTAQAPIANGVSRGNAWRSAAARITVSERVKC